MNGLIRKPKDFISGLFFVAVGAFVFVYSYNYAFGTALRMGAGYFPWLLSLLLMALGAILFVRSFRGRSDAFGSVALRPACLVLGGALLYGLLLEPAGLIAAIMAAVVVGSRADSEITLLKSILLGAFLSAASAVVFVYLLGQQLPLRGSWFS